MDGTADYELVDLGDGERLERFGDRLVRRPYPPVFGPPRRPEAWAGATLRFDRQTGWSGPHATRGPWVVSVHGLRLELRPASGGQVGLFPEHIAMLPWLGSETTAAGTPAVLHLFAYTGLATLALAAAGARVTHVDSSRPAVAWARRNAELSDLNDRPVRWIVDDALAFTRREARRVRRYHGVVLDPPSYGHGPDGDWRIERDLPTLLTAIADVLEPDGFVLLTAHTEALDPASLQTVLADALGRPRSTIKAGDLASTTDEGRTLFLGAFARSARGA